jgi:hypothetical protein
MLVFPTAPHAIRGVCSFLVVQALCEGRGAIREEGDTGTGGGGRERGRDEVNEKMEWSVSNKAGML